jgi:hypothetical protein
MLAVALPAAAAASSAAPPAARLSFHPDIVDLEAFAKQTAGGDIAGRGHTYILQLCIEGKVVTDPPFPDESKCQFHEFVARSPRGQFLLNLAEALAYFRAAKARRANADSRAQSAQKALAAAPMIGPDYSAAGKAQHAEVNANAELQRYDAILEVLKKKVDALMDKRRQNAPETEGDARVGADVFVVTPAKK